MVPLARAVAMYQHAVRAAIITKRAVEVQRRGYATSGGFEIFVEAAGIVFQLHVLPITILGSFF